MRGSGNADGHAPFARTREFGAAPADTPGGGYVGGGVSVVEGRGVVAGSGVGSEEAAEELQTSEGKEVGYYVRRGMRE